MYHRYSISELSHAIGRQNNVDPAEVTRDFVARWIGNDDKICLRPDMTIEALAEFSLIWPAPQVEHIDGRGMPASQDYAQSRLSILHRIFLCENSPDGDLWYEKSKRSLGYRYPNSFYELCESYSSFIREHGLTREQEDILLKVTVRASLVLRYCLSVWDRIPVPFLMDINPLLNIKPKRGQKKDEETQKPKSHAAFDRLMQAGLYEVQVDGAPTAARLIQEIFEFDVDVKSIASDIRQRHNEILANQQRDKN